MGAPAQTNLLVLDDGMLRSMMEDPRFTNAFPCIANGKRQLDTYTDPNCGRCGKKTKADRRAEVVSSVYQCITSMSMQQRNEFKRLVNARQVRVLRVNSRGTTRITF